MDSVQNMASSSSSTVPSSERTSHFVSQTETEMESSKARHWSQLDYSTVDSEMSAETNSKYFALLKENPQWGRFFKDFPALEVGEKISGGAQADIYEARNTRDGPFDLVVKVMKGDVPLKAFQTQWPLGMLSARSKYKHLIDLPLIIILGGTVLHDKRLRGRFAFVMYRRWGDLRLLIDRQMKQERNSHGPFSIDEAIHLMLSIAEDMDTLHKKHDILHRDLKASNVLVWEESGEDVSLVATSNHLARIGSVVVDFESSVGVLGTGFWRAPEILEQLKDRVPSSEVQFTRASDVYSYGMTCYEIVTGCLPYDGLGGEDTISRILQGQCPEFPHELPDFVRNIIIGCWHSDPSKRPSFSTICMALKLKRNLNPVTVFIDNKTQRGVSIVKVEQWNNLQALPLLEVMPELRDVDLLVLKAFDSSSTTMITQYFEVSYCKGRKALDDKSIANFIEFLSLAVKIKYLSEILDTSINENTIVQMHVIDVVAKWSTGLLGALSRLLVATNFRVSSLAVQTKCLRKTLGTSIDENTSVKIHVIEVVANRGIGLLRNLSRLLVATNFRVHSAGCLTCKGQVKCVIYVEGARMGILLWKLRHMMEDFQIYCRGFKITVHRVAAKEFSHLNRRLHNLKFIDLTLPRSPSNIRVHHRKELKEGFCSAEAIVCLEKGCRLVDVSRNLADMDYKIVGASINYPGPYAILKGKVNKSEDIDVGTLGKDESKNMIHQILDISTEHGCPDDNRQLIVCGPNEELYDDLVRSLCLNDLVVIGGQVYHDGMTFCPNNLEFFVTENLATEAS